MAHNQIAATDTFDEGVEEDEQVTTTLEELLNEIKANPHVLPANLAPRLEPLMKAEFPPDERRPRAIDVDDSVYRTPPQYNPDNPKAPPCMFTTGQWIERYHDDMKWHLEPIRRVVVKEEINPDTGELSPNYFYKTSAGVLVKHDLVRAPEEGLKRAFGFRPWIWQQFALLKTEEYVRFQNQHQRDFVEVDFMALPTRLWTQWLNDPSNQDFKSLHDSKPLPAQIKLKDHIFKIFQHLNRVTNMDSDWWPLDDAELSVYQYNSMFGSGYVTAIGILFIQALVPMLMLVYSARQANRFINSPFNTNTGDWHDIFQSNATIFCDEGVPLDTLIMNFVVFMLYTMRVVPRVMNQVYLTMGDQPSVASRLNSIRQEIWYQGDDDLWMQIGFKLDRYMNAVYPVILNLTMLMILFLTQSTIDVILNALALDFVDGLDEEIAAALWYDADKRYMMAGIVECLFRLELRLEWLKSSEVFAHHLYCPNFGQLAGGPVHDNALAKKDSIDPKFLAPEDILWGASMECVNTLKGQISAEAGWQFSEGFNAFGVVDWLVTRMGLRTKGILSRYNKYRTWSRWRVAWMNSPLHSTGEIITVKGKMTCTSHCEAPALPSVRNAKLAGTYAHKLKHLVGIPGGVALYNYHPTSSWSPTRRFTLQLSRTLLGLEGVVSIRAVAKRGDWRSAVFRTSDAGIEIMGMWVIMMFPIALVAYCVLIFACQPVL